jgi:hypothetical protein
MGARLYQDSSNASHVRSEARHSLFKAQAWLAGPIEKDRISIDALQVQCLLILAR